MKTFFQISILFALGLFLFQGCHKQETPVSQSETIVSEVNNQQVTDRDVCCTYHIAASGSCPKYRYDLDLFLTTKGLQVCSYATDAVPSSSLVCVKWTPQSGSINFGNYGDLRTVLGIPTGNTDQAHHIIPKQLCDDFSGSTSSALHAVVRKAARDGFHPNDGYNGYRVPQANHSGSHPAYTAWVRFQLDQYALQAGSPNFRQVNKWIQCKLIPVLRTRIASAISSGQTVNQHFATLPLVFIGL